MSVFCPLAVAQDPADEAAADDRVGGKWRGVSRIKGVATVFHRFSVEEADLYPSEESRDGEEVTVRFELVRDDDATGAGTIIWRVRELSLAGWRSYQQSYRSSSTFGTLTVDAQYSGAADDADDVHLDLSTESGRWVFHSPSHTREKYTETTRYNQQDFTFNQWMPDIRTYTNADNRVESVPFSGTIADQPGITIGTVLIDHTPADQPTRPGQRWGRIEFWPEYDDYTLEVRIDDYADWRPLGRVDQPGKAGNNLTAKATVLPKGDAAAPQVRAIRFQLLDVSREPGVCLNWPLGAKDRDPDLRLAAAPESPGSLSQEDQRLEVTQPLVDNLRRPYALARIDSFDFGARAMLRVTAELLDGRELVGEFVAKDGEAAQDLIRLPNMTGPYWIASAWKQEHGVAELPDSDDSEKVDGQDNDGDGYTLYEEYRGWVVAGKRLEGDPERKDFFVLNLIGADARKGIDLFEKLSQLRVHSKLRRSEMSQKTRLMNGNHRDAPQRVKQHGVWVKAFGTVKELGVTGAVTTMTKKGVSGRPGITIGIGLLTRDHKESAFNQPYNLPKYFSVLAYDRAIAHELMHSVGVEEHGKGDWHLSARWTSPNNRRNKVGRPYFRELMTDDMLTLLDESGGDLAMQGMADYREWVELYKNHPTYKTLWWDKWIAEGKAFIEARPGYQLELDTPEKYAENEMENSMGHSIYGAIVGELHGEHSGHQDCLMRYYFAEYYPAEGRKDTYYLVTPGTEPYGLEICRTTEGTGVNATSHKPQSRYGDAGPNGGKCFGQITPNDAIPPKRL